MYSRTRTYTAIFAHKHMLQSSVVINACNECYFLFYKYEKFDNRFDTGFRQTVTGFEKNSVLTSLINAIV